MKRIALRAAVTALLCVFLTPLLSCTYVEDWLGLSKRDPITTESGTASEAEPRKDYTPTDGEALDVVDVTKAEYSYSEMIDDIEILSAKYPGKFTYSTVGETLDDRRIYEIRVGGHDADKQIVISAGIHAREYLTPLLVMRQLEYYLSNLDGGSYDGIAFSEIFEEYTFCILPMCNPDGVTLAESGIYAIRSFELRDKIREVYESDVKLGYTTDPIEAYLTYWKANARGVDLNRNFDTRDYPYVSYTLKPCFKNYKGTAPLSEPETKALTDYVKTLENPVLTVAVHSQGEVIYFDCGQDNTVPSLALANAVKKMNGYTISYDVRREAAFDDWCILNRNIPSVTVEVGGAESTCPLNISEFDKIWKENRDLWFAVATYHLKSTK